MINKTIQQEFKEPSENAEESAATKNKLEICMAMAISDADITKRQFTINPEPVVDSDCVRAGEKTVPGWTGAPPTSWRSSGLQPEAWN